MGFWELGRARLFRGVAMMAVLGLGLLAQLAPAQAEGGENSLFKQRKTQKLINSGQALPSNATSSSGHSKGSGLKATTETAIINDGSISPFISADSPAAMQQMESKYAAIVSSGGWPTVPNGKAKKGDTGKNVAALNKRLFVEGYLRSEATQGEYAEVFTSATEEALKSFQRNHGLAATGSIDGPTLAALNVSAQKRLATIRANIPRLAEYSKDLGDRYVVVNVPAQQIETINNGTVYSLHNAIVGRPSRPTPVVMTPLTTIRFNPYWNAPASIVERDILPRMVSRGASKIMNEMNMKVFRGVGGPEIDPDSVNWRSAVVDDYHFRQEPGGSNAMATAKIEFNSPFGIYLHDTPEPHLFATGNRFYSSGCVRVEKVAVLINWILQGQDGIDQNRIAELAETKERLDTAITTPPQLRVAYLTSWPTREGVAAFRNDIYDLDGSGFVLGQPLPVGETQGGQRYVLKPIPRSPEAVDADEAFGFASLFRSRNPDKQSTGIPKMTKVSDSLIKLDNKDKSKAASKKAKPSKDKKDTATARRVNPDKDTGIPSAKAADGGSKAAAKSKKKPATAAKKPDGKTKTADAKAKPGDAAKTKTAAKAAAKTDAAAAKKKPVATADAKPADKSADKKPSDAKAVAAKSIDAKSTVKTAAKTPDASKAPAAAGKKPAAKKPSACVAGSDGKLPAGCPPVAAKKPAAKPAKTAAAAN